MWEGLLSKVDRKGLHLNCEDPSSASWQAMWHSGQQRALRHRPWASLVQDPARLLEE